VSEFDPFACPDGGELEQMFAESGPVCAYCGSDNWGVERLVGELTVYFKVDPGEEPSSLTFKRDGSERAIHFCNDCGEVATDWIRLALEKRDAEGSK
jgi:hypothetical protein